MNILQTESSPSRFPMVCSAFQHADPRLEIGKSAAQSSIQPLVWPIGLLLICNKCRS